MSEELRVDGVRQDRFTRHERRVLSPLVLTGFFETYDVALLTLAAPVLAHGLGLGIGAFAICVGLIRSRSARQRARPAPRRSLGRPDAPLVSSPCSPSRPG